MPIACTPADDALLDSALDEPLVIETKLRRPIEDPREFEDAMHQGIDAILRYYDPYVVTVSTRRSDQGRAPLNQQDLARSPDS